MNDDDIVTGTSLTSDRIAHVFVWKASQGQTIDLGTGPASAGGAATFAVAINARGDIIGYTCATYTWPACGAPHRAVLWRVR